MKPMHSSQVQWSWSLFFLLLAVSTGRGEIAFERSLIVEGPGNQSYPAIWGNHIVWSGTRGQAYDIAARALVPMPGLSLEGAPAIRENKVVWPGVTGYYDLTTQSYAGPPAGNRTAPDVFGRRYVAVPYDGVPPVVHDVYVWDPSCGVERLSDSGAAGAPAISADTVVWVERGQVGPDGSAGYSALYMARILGCCGDAEHPYPVGDLNQDCRVDLADLAILLSHWLECTDPAHD